MSPSEMTAVYSGGLLYEYALEPNDFGIVKISGDSVTEQTDFAKFESALKKYPAPTGDGGFTSTTKAVACPTKDANWLVDSTLLPALPDNAKQYFSNGAGTGPGTRRRLAGRRRQRHQHRQRHPRHPAPSPPPAPARARAAPP